ncbi:D-aminoacyl-tRNA deacylase [Synergistales bacterium]|nr:D-aminoacyl-tRNA deacylase [Synergistales bacterium]
MRAVVQRVSRSRVSVRRDSAAEVPDFVEAGKIGVGLCVLLGVGAGDTERDAEWLADKVAHLRIFEDENDKMNLSVLDKGGGVLVVSQFTLYGDCRKGRRPSFVGAASAGEGKRLYEYFVERVRSLGVETNCGCFQTHMLVEIDNDGPVTLILDTSDK